MAVRDRTSSQRALVRRSGCESLVGRLLAVIVLLSAALSAAQAAAPTPAPGPPATPSYLVKPGDVLEISVWKEPDLQKQVLVRPDGAFSFPLVGEVDARGKSVPELNKIVGAGVGRYISDAVVTISVQEIKGNKIYVLGQVNKPGEFIVNPSVNIMQALSMAGGMTPFAATNDIIVLRGQGKAQQAMAFRYNEVVRGRNLDTNIELQSGDIVVVP
jgi:polysaccharide export outer membrane protein